MKKIILTGSLLIAFLFLFSGCLPGNYTTLSSVTPTVTFQSFYDDLTPYGTWMDYPGYGQVWHPRMNDDFRPYASGGHWIYSNEGWSWESDYNWGWAPFHYGRWTYDDYYGWLWVPGYEWSPAWVTWGSVDDYYAWAPLMPEVNINIQFGNWKPNNHYWSICSRNHIYDRDLGRNIERPDRIRDFNNRVSIINNFNTTGTHKQFYSRGPEQVDVERYSSRKVDQVTLKPVNKVRQADPQQQSGNVIKVFRPAPAQIPQPREYRRVENNQVNPIRTPEQKPVMQSTEQNRNIDRLPVYKNNEPPKRTPDEPKMPPKKRVGD